MPKHIDDSKSFMFRVVLEAIFMHSVLLNLFNLRSHHFCLSQPHQATYVLKTVVNTQQVMCFSTKFSFNILLLFFSFPVFFFFGIMKSSLPNRFDSFVFRLFSSNYNWEAIPQQCQSWVVLSSLDEFTSPSTLDCHVSMNIKMICFGIRWSLSITFHGNEGMEKNEERNFALTGQQSANNILTVTSIFKIRNLTVFELIIIYTWFKRMAYTTKH